MIAIRCDAWNAVELSLSVRLRGRSTHSQQKREESVDLEDDFRTFPLMPNFCPTAS